MQHSPARPSVRVLVVCWCMWLLVAWGLMWMRMSIGLASVRWLVFVSAFGMLLVWPALRLSQLSSVSGVFLDWCALNVVWQAVIWPLKEIAVWPVEQVIWLALTMAAWSLATGWLIAFGSMWKNDAWRAAVMLGCVLLLVGEPVAMVMSGARWQFWVSPIGALWAFTEPAGYFQPRLWVLRVIAFSACTAGAWGMLGTWRVLQRSALARMAR